MVGERKRQATEGLAAVFAAKPAATETAPVRRCHSRRTGDLHLAAITVACAVPFRPREGGSVRHGAGSAGL